MTSVPELVDPYAQFWANVDTPFTPQQQEQAQKLHERSKTKDLAVLAAVLGGMWLLHNQAVRDKIREVLKDKEPDPITLNRVIRQAAGMYGLAWTTMVGGVLLASYREGVEASGGTLPEDVLVNTVNQYSIALGKHMQTVSTDAVLNGYQALRNRGWGDAKALNYALRAFGVDQRTMNSLVTVWTTDEPKKNTSLPLESVKESRARKMVDRALGDRARVFGDTETWTARTQAKQLVWMFGMEEGVIPAEATRVWVTARDEKVCPVCGPMHKREAPVNEQFKVAGGELWTPPAHPNCRCDVILSYNVQDQMESKLQALVDSQKVTKAFGDDPYNRDKRGKFAEVESREQKMIREAQQARLADLYDQARAKYGADSGEERLKKVERLNSNRLNSNRLKKVERLQPKAERLQAKTDRVAPPARLIQQRIKAQRIKVASNDRLRSDLERLKTQKPRTWSSGLHPNYIKLEQPLFALKFRSEMDAAHSSPPGTDPVLLISDNEKVFSNLPYLETQIRNHWDEVLDNKLREQSQIEDPFGEMVYPMNIKHAGRGHFVTAQIPHFEMDAAWQAVLMDNEEALTSPVEVVYEDNDGQMRTTTVQRHEIADYFGFMDHIEEEMPTLVVMHWGFAGKTETSSSKYGDYGHNPGYWRIESYDVASPKSSGSPFYNRAVVIPPEH